MNKKKEPEKKEPEKKEPEKKEPEKKEPEKKEPENISFPQRIKGFSLEAFEASNLEEINALKEKIETSAKKGVFVYKIQKVEFLRYFYLKYGFKQVGGTPFISLF